MDILIKLVQFILCFSLLVFVHEGGHFLFAKLFKIKVEKFYLFFNPWFSLFKFKWGETEYGIGWIPFGGYVSIAGMIDETKDATKLASEPQPWEFRSKPAWQRLLVMVGGVLMNIITAIVIFIFMSYSIGSSYIDSKDVKDGFAYTDIAKEIGFQDGDKILSVNGESFANINKYREAIIINDNPVVEVQRGSEIVRIQLKDTDVPKLLKDQIIYTLRVPLGVDSVMQNSILANAGIQPKDSIISLNGIVPKYVDELQNIVKSNVGNDVQMVYSRAGAIDTVTLSIGKDALLGIQTNGLRVQNYYKVTQVEYSFLESIPRGFVMTGDMCVSYLKQIKMIFNPETEAYKSVGSVLTMGNLFSPVWDWVYFWNITALFSVILAIMNLLPIPALDGGHVLFTIVEMVTGRRPSDKFLEIAQTAGFYILMGIMVLAMWNDIVKFFL